MTVQPAVQFNPRGPVENSKNLQRLRKRLEGDVAQAIADCNMIEHGDTLLVCISGGKDSYAMLSMLMAMQKRAPIDFRLITNESRPETAWVPGGCPTEHLAGLGVEYRIVEQDTYSIVKEKIPEERRPVRSAHAFAAASFTARRRAPEQQDRARPPSRRYRAHAVPQSPVRRQTQGHATKTGHR